MGGLWLHRDEALRAPEWGVRTRWFDRVVLLVAILRPVDRDADESTCVCQTAMRNVACVTVLVALGVWQLGLLCIAAATRPLLRRLSALSGNEAETRQGGAEEPDRCRYGYGVRCYGGDVYEHMV